MPLINAYSRGGTSAPQVSINQARRPPNLNGVIAAASLHLGLRAFLVEKIIGTGGDYPTNEDPNQTGDRCYVFGLHEHSDP